MNKSELIRRLQINCSSERTERLRDRVVRMGKENGVRLTRAVGKASLTELEYICQRFSDLQVLNRLHSTLTAKEENLK